MNNNKHHTSNAISTHKKYPIVIGINAYHADASAAIFMNGKMIAAIEEERLTRIKHTAGFPVLAILFCIKEAGISYKDVDHFVIGRDPKAKLFKRIKYLLSQSISGTAGIRHRIGNRKKIQSLSAELSRITGAAPSFFKNKIVHVEHHRSHLAAAFYASGFERAACISIDGSGDFSTMMMGVGSPNGIEVKQSQDFPHSIGIFYTACTQWLGFPHYGDEYKVMGMAPYGQPIHAEKLRKLIRPTTEGSFKLDMQYFIKPGTGIISYDENNIPIVATLFNKKFLELLGAARSPSEEIMQLHKDMAASVQLVTEEIIFHLLRHLHAITRLDMVCIAGGVAQNSVANGKITRHTPFKKVFIPSAGHDAGISMGAGMYQLFQNLKLPVVKNTSPYLGSRFSNDEIEIILQKENIVYKKYDDTSLYDLVSDLIIDGAVVGWFCGRSEFGPRALGGRSIIADPRRADAKELINSKIKRRESFRPFAPSILAEEVGNFFDVDEPVPYMEKVFPIRKEKQPLIPAVTHIDGTGRLQSVTKEMSPRYHALIKNFFEKTGIPILLNTSFNENEPIVNTPKEALNCYLRTSMDVLVLENMVVIRDNEHSVNK